GNDTRPAPDRVAGLAGCSFAESAAESGTVEPSAVEHHAADQRATERHAAGHDPIARAAAGTSERTAIRSLRRCQLFRAGAARGNRAWPSRSTALTLSARTSAARRGR